jgi:hypothetical protein
MPWLMTSTSDPPWMPAVTIVWSMFFRSTRNAAAVVPLTAVAAMP